VITLAVVTEPYWAKAFSRPSDVVAHARLPTKMFLLITQTLSLAAPKTPIAAPTAAVRTQMKLLGRKLQDDSSEYRALCRITPQRDCFHRIKSDGTRDSLEPQPPVLNVDGVAGSPDTLRSSGKNSKTLPPESFRHLHPIASFPALKSPAPHIVIPRTTRAHSPAIFTKNS
jgi:hypothetical protein